MKQGDRGGRKSKVWGPPGWPWEMELVALVFVILAIVVPYRLESQRAAAAPAAIAPAAVQPALPGATDSSIRDAVPFLWAVALIGIYVGHLVVAGASTSYLSTPVTYVVAPLVFAGITYYRLLQVVRTDGARLTFVTGAPLEIVAWFAVVFLVCTGIARLRMLRHRLRFRDIEWDLTTPTLLDRTLFTELLLEWTPVLYPARRYRACPEGILIEGWLYLVAIHFDTIQSVQSARKASVFMKHTYFATSTRRLLEIRTTERSEPIGISPVDDVLFRQYCHERLAARRADAPARR